MLLDLVADGKWHSFEAVITALSVTVTPGEAVRETERLRARLNPNSPRQRRMSLENQILSGQRNIIKDTIRTHTRTGVLETRGTDSAKQIRLAHSDTLSVVETAEYLNRAATSVRKWLRQPALLQEVRRHITEPRVEPVIYRNSRAQIPQAALNAWVTVTRSRPRPSKLPFDSIVTLTSSVFHLDQDTAKVRTSEFLRGLARINCYIRRYGMGDVMPPQTTPPETPAEDRDTVS